MRRRDLIAGLSHHCSPDLATTAASALQAAEQNKVRRLAACSQNLTDFSSPPWALLFERLQQMGFAEGKTDHSHRRPRLQSRAIVSNPSFFFFFFFFYNLIIDRYATDGRPDRYAEVARNIVQANPDVIALGFDHEFILQVARETSTVPIIATFGDPVAAGIVKNMARPERNISGVSLDAGIEMQGKHLEILREAVPSASRIAYLSNRTEWEGAWGEAVREAGQRLGVSIVGVPMERSAGDAEYRQAFETMARQSVQALMANEYNIIK